MGINHPKRVEIPHQDMGINISIRLTLPGVPQTSFYAKYCYNFNKKDVIIWGTQLGLYNETGFQNDLSKSPNVGFMLVCSDNG